MGKKNKVVTLTDRKIGWHTSIHDGKKVFVCVVLDDSSRRILAGG